ncbi:VOC family protein [Saccharomonospora sp. NPDC046836]|uniref:VOC family protein n=1 Tax=Saccharomonospora sp. NPDC046836 TaxID=3156921 RepID=UPI0033CD923F
MRAEDQFHLGIVVDDVEATTAMLSSVFGYEWGPEVGSPTAVTLPGGAAVLDLRCAFSVSVPRLELVRSVPETLWEPVAGAGIHHIGFWSDDVAGDSAELARHGYVTEATRTGPDGAPFFTFQRSETGFRIELVTRAAQAGLEICWTNTDGGKR